MCYNISTIMWQLTNRADITVARLADDHYSRQTKGSRQFTPPGQVIILVIDNPDNLFRAAAGWAWHRPHPDKAKRMDGYDGWYNCCFFHNESQFRSSDLIKEAIEWAIKIWGIPQYGFDTYVMPTMIKSTNPGYCYQCVGWKRDGWSKDKHKRRLYLDIKEYQRCLSV